MNDYCFPTLEPPTVKLLAIKTSASFKVILAIHLMTLSSVLVVIGQFVLLIGQFLQGFRKCFWGFLAKLFSSPPRDCETSCGS